MELLALLLMHLVCVGANFIFEARLESYQNPIHSIFNGDCCDGVPDLGGACTDPCDNEFLFCIQESTEPISLQQEACTFLYHVSSIFQDNDDITFSPNEDLGGGVSNPLSFNGTGTWPAQGVRFAVRARETDSGVRTAVVGHPVTVVNISSGSDFSSMTIVDETVPFLSMTVSFRVMCTGNSMGPDCSICSEGFQNPASGCTETCTPAQGCSPIGGFCNAPGVCVCRDGYSGENCDIDLDPCAHTTPCQNGGTCVTTGPDQFECQCVEGYEGDTCEDETDECDPNPCLNGGTCTDRFRNFECQCVEGYEGDTCGLMVTDECDPDPCQNGGTCTDRFQNFECQCVEGYEGDTCGLMVTDECDPDPCLNGGTCTDMIADYSCSCVSGFTGKNCTEEEEAASDSVSPPVIGGAVAAGIIVIVVTLVLVLVIVQLLKRRQKAIKVSGGGSGKSDTIDVKPNPVYGVSLQQTPQAEVEYYGMGPDKSKDYVYDYVEEAGTATVPINSNPAYAIPLSENPAYYRHS